MKANKGAMKEMEAMKGAENAISVALNATGAMKAMKNTKAKTPKKETWIYIHSDRAPKVFVRVEHTTPIGWEVFPRRDAGCAE